VEQVVVVQGIREPVDLGQRLGRARDVALRDRAVEPHHRRGIQPRQQRVQAEHLRPVGLFPGRCLAMDRGDRGVELVRTRAAQPGRALDQPGRRRDRWLVPQRAILVFEQHQAAPRVQACRPAPQVQPNQRQQAERFGLVGQQPHQQAGQHSASRARSRRTAASPPVAR
jgi:hypothetical protein